MAVDPRTCIGLACLITLWAGTCFAEDPVRPPEPEMVKGGWVLDRVPYAGTYAADEVILKITRPRCGFCPVTANWSLTVDAAGRAICERDTMQFAKPSTKEIRLTRGIDWIKTLVAASFMSLPESFPDWHPNIYEADSTKVSVSLTDWEDTSTARVDLRIGPFKHTVFLTYPALASPIQLREIIREAQEIIELHLPVGGE